MASYRIPIVLTPDEKSHDVPDVGALISPAYLPISAQMYNCLVNVTDGLFVAPETFISAQPNNIIVIGADGKLFVPPPDVSIDIASLVSQASGNELTIVDGKLFVPVPTVDLQAFVSSMPDNLIQIIDGKIYVAPGDLDNPVSAETGNYLRRANSDGLAFLDAGGVLSNESRNILGVSDVDGKIMLTEDAIAPVSVDPGNFIRTGVTGGAYLDANDILSNEAGNALDISIVDNKIFFRGVNVSDILSDEVDQLLSVDPEGKLLLTSAMLASVAGIPDAPADGKTYVRRSGAWMSDAGNLTVDPRSSVLSQSNTGLYGAVGMTYNALTRSITLTGVNDAPITSVTLPAGTTFRYGSIVTNPAGQPSGTYLALTFNDGTSDATSYTDVTSLVDRYTAANASISVVGNQIGVNVDPASGLSIGAAGLTMSSGYVPMSTADKAKLDSLTPASVFIVY